MMVDFSRLELARSGDGRHVSVACLILALLRLLGSSLCRALCQLSRTDIVLHHFCTLASFSYLFKQ